MTDEKWRSPNGHSIASDVTDKLPPKDEARDDVSEALDWCAKIRILALNIQADDSFTKQLGFIERVLIAQQPPVNEWQPIDTAPKDDYIVVTDGGFIAQAFWSGKCWMMGFIEGNINVKVDLQPTHWMPLPEPPRAEQKGQNHE